MQTRELRTKAWQPLQAEAVTGQAGGKQLTSVSLPVGNILVMLRVTKANGAAGQPSITGNFRASQTTNPPPEKKKEKKPEISYKDDSPDLEYTYSGVSLCSDDDFTDCYVEFKEPGDLAYVGDDNNDDTESITVGTGMVATLWEHRDFTWRSTTLSCGYYILEGELQDVSSVQVRAREEKPCDFMSGDPETAEQFATTYNAWP
jgi:hypothetical protein